jgi:hypothetical protein
MRGSDDDSSRSLPKIITSTKPPIQRDSRGIYSLAEKKQQKEKRETARHFREIIRLVRYPK